ncbi:P-loop containing nucleoside triphosphate hydrolase protein [Lipomyces doorenjongii]|uniref:P-loop containing nucleoside triphosphate hydrolase protein n=1 Tax=Lipomyces doorenjongii TaxID=383834 RepID=UPI003343C7A4
MSSKTWDYIAKIVMIGDSACGKSSLTVRLTDNTFSENHDVTIAAEIGSKIVPVDDNVYIKLQIWDTAGQEHYRAVTRSYFRNATGCLLVYDVTRRDTFLHVQEWLADLRAQADPEICVLLVGNKCDLSDTQRQVSIQEAREWALANGLMDFVETSAKTGDRVEEAYLQVAREIYYKIKGGKFDVNDKTHGIKINSAKYGNSNGLNLDANSQNDVGAKGRCC